jgi:hypothetical protein
VLHALPLGDVRDALALLLLALDPGLPGVLHGKDAPRPGESSLQRGWIIQVCLNDLGALGCQRLRGFTGRIPRHRLDLVPVREEFPDHSSTLVTSSSSDENSISILLHGMLHLRRPHSRRLAG